MTTEKEHTLLCPSRLLLGLGWLVSQPLIPQAGSSLPLAGSSAVLEHTSSGLQPFSRPRGTDQRRGRVVLVDERRTSRVSSAVNGQQPCERQQVEARLVRPAWSQQRDQPVQGMMWCPVVAPRKPPQAPCSSQAATQAAASEAGPSTPLPAKRNKRTKAEPAAEPTKGEGKAQGKAAKAKPAPQPGRWLDRDCNAQGALPAKGKEYPGLGYKRVRDRSCKAQQQ
ncbi:hypothetical protein QJQ45_007811 [Haematococcus lacustris]|nr:hypothetical protein QJQ45_007811 [Haematococcus lacustris]